MWVGKTIANAMLKNKQKRPVISPLLNDLDIEKGKPKPQIEKTICEVKKQLPYFATGQAEKFEETKQQRPRTRFVSSSF